MKSDLNQIFVLKLKNPHIYFADPNLLQACSEGNLEIVQYLVSKGAAFNIRDRWGGSPLSDAERGKFAEIVLFLLSSGATRPEFRGGENPKY
jgi:hypothetical protein